jgi:hypothetical protein
MEAEWTAWTEPGFAFTRAIASWNAAGPLEIFVQGRTTNGSETAWYSLGRWSYNGPRTSVPGQDDEHASVDTDTLVAKVPLTAYRLRTSATAATLSVVVTGEPVYAPSEPMLKAAVVVDVPGYSQMLHPGGEAWCSAASTAMLLAYWDLGPTDAESRVVHAARHTYDEAYGGTGNWPFNVAYAHHFGLEGTVTCLRSLAEAEDYVRAGIPLAASLSLGLGELDGFPLPSTDGHVLTIVGFTAEGDVVSNDPAAPTNDEVRRVYVREQFERAWLTSSGGVVYLLHPPTDAS